MLAGFLLAMREGLEAALVIGIVLGVLRKLKKTQLNRMVWIGLVAAVFLSTVIAAAIYALGMEFDGLGEMIFEGSAMLLAASVLTWMIIWMNGSQGNQKSEIETKTQQAMIEHNGRGIFALAFFAVLREGVELALFLLAVEKASSPLQTYSGAIIGLAVAVFAGWMIFNSTKKLSLNRFFQVTNVMLVIFAAGMVATGVHEYTEAGILPALINPVWDTGFILPDTSELGLLLKALIGYHSAPTLAEVLAYLTFL